MNDEQWKTAEQLAARHYITVVNREKTEAGEYYYVATHPDLPGCVADGETPEEAKQELAEARVDFIYFLLEDNLFVPEPKTYKVTISSQLAKAYTDMVDQRQPIPSSGYVVGDLVPV